MLLNVINALFIQDMLLSVINELFIRDILLNVITECSTIHMGWMYTTVEVLL